MPLVDDLNLFFEDPLLPLDQAGVPDTNPSLLGGTCRKYSTLYLLRRDIGRCFGATPPIYWPGTMAVLAGVDLLAKLYAGNDATSGGAIGQRFRTFADQRMSGGDGASLWQLRNAVLHSYGVYFEEPAPAPPGGRGGSSLLPSVPKKFRLSATVNSLITPIAGSLFANLPNDIIEIDVNELKASFDAAIANYETYIRGNATEQISHFEPMFKKYGWLYICEETITGSGLLLTKGASGG